MDRVIPLQEVRVEGGKKDGGQEADPRRQLQLEAPGFMQTVLGNQAAGGMSQAQKLLDSLSSKSSFSSSSSSHRHNSRPAARRVVRVRLEWRDLTYRVPVGRRRRRSWRTVLRGSSGELPPGRLLAVLGPTGCGKTSLLNALAARLPPGGEVEGEVLVNGRPRGKGFRTISAFVQQDDVSFHNLTVRETLSFAAALRLPSSVPAAARHELVTRTIAELGLAKVEGTYIGNAFVRGISGGERKRVSIGVQLLANPSLLFLDEPTSGLDAFQAQKVMEALWALARSGRSVVATIHQPRSSIYSMFDILLLMSQGETVYFGPASQAVAWFTGCGYKCPPYYNPPDFFLDVISPDYRSPELEEASRRRVALLAEAFRLEGPGKAGGGPGLAVEDSAHSGSGNQSGNETPPSLPPSGHWQGEEAAEAEGQAALRELDAHPGFPNSLPVEFGLLLARAWKQASRDRLPQAISLIQTVVIGAILAAMYSSIPNNQVGIQDETGILFFSSIFVAFNALFGSLNTFPVDRNVVQRERANKSYRMLPYYLARFICDVPLRVGQALLFGCIVYWAVGLNPSAAAFFAFVGLLLVEALASQGLGVAVSAGCKNEKVAFAIAPAVTVILILFGGFYINKNSIPGWLRWLTWLSHLYWAFIGLVDNNFRLGFGGSHLWEGFVGLAVLTVVYNALGYVILRLSKPRFLPLAAHSSAGRRSKRGKSVQDGAEGMAV